MYLAKRLAIGFLAIFLLFPAVLFSQCTLTVTSFPYVEDFESGGGGWFSGGVNNDWDMGNPTKPTISAAGSGNVCWMVGGLTTSFYSLGQRSWVQSPCFDFTNLNHPYISLMIYWESEWRFDGTNLQFSTNNGLSWNNVGSYNEPADCYTQNWYNQNNITNLSGLGGNTNGWSGNHFPTSGSCQGGNGSNGWVVAKHCLDFLANQPSVIFRMTFGAGTTCNNYDGIAFDLVRIEDAPPAVADFSFACSSGNTFSFTNTSSNCPEIYTWNFGDGASSSQPDPVHTFSGSGTYTVSLIANNSCAGGTSISKTITVLAPSVVSTPVSCTGASDGAAFVDVSGLSGLNFSWSTNPVQTSQTATALSPGNYTVVVSGASVCSATASVIITEPPLLAVSASAIGALCSNGTGSLSALASGGTGTYSYQWNPGGGNSDSVNGVPPGNYTVVVSDANNCSASSSITVTAPAAITSSLTSSDVSCFGGSNGSVLVTASGGSGTFSYQWIPAGGNSAVNTGLSAGNYTVIITDQIGCTSSNSITLSQPSAIQLTLASTAASCAGTSDGTASVTVSGGSPGYGYQWSPSGGSNSLAGGLTAGTYQVLVTDNAGCTASSSVVVSGTPPITLQTPALSPICIGQSVEVLVSAVGGTPGYTYSWNNGWSGSSQTLQPVITTTYTLIVTDANNCQSAPVPITITVYPPLNVSTVPVVDVCAGDDVQLSALAQGGNGGPYAFSWDNGVTGSTQTVAPLTDSTFTVTLTDGCGSPSSNSTVNVIVHPLPSVNFSPFPLTGCKPFSAQFNQQAVTEAGSSFLWNFGDGNTSVDEDPSHTYVNSGTFPVSLTVISPFGCTDSLVVENAVSIFGFSGATFYQSASEVSIFSPVIFFRDQTSGAQIWSWDFGDGSIGSADQNPFHQYSDTGTYEVRLIVQSAGGCRDTTFGRVRIEQDFVMYLPDAFTPNGDEVNDVFYAYGSGFSSFEMNIYNRWGKQIFTSRDPVIGWDGTFQSSNCQGDVYTYLIKVTDGYKKEHTLKGRVMLIR